MTRPRITTSDQLSNAELTISNSLNDAELKALVAPYGYNDEKLAEGKQLYDAARAAVSAQEDATGAQQAATKTLLAAQEQANAAYQALAKMARAVADPTALTRLGLGGRMPQSIGAFLAAAGTLFDNAPNIPELSKYGYNAAKLTDERAKISAYSVANRSQETAKTVAKAATVAQNAALTALNKWTAQYIKVARVALSAQPEMLGRLGVTARSGPTAAQRAARKKKTTPPAS